MPLFEDAAAPTRDFAIAGQFGKSISITDGECILHQAPAEDNQPLCWHGYCLARFLRCDLGDFVDGKRTVANMPSWPTPTWLSDKRTDPNELVNLADERPDRVREMQAHLKQTLIDLKAPPEQAKRLGLGA